MTAFRSLLRGIVGLLICAQLGVAQAPRNVVDLRLDLKRAAWIVEDADAALMFLPNMVAIIGDMVVVTDPEGPAVLAFDLRTGRQRWRHGRKGGGPGEWRAPVIAAWHPDGVLVVDNDRRRLYLLSRAGDLLSETPVPMGQFVGAICSFHDRTVLLSVAAIPSRSLILVHLDGSKAPEYRYPFAASDVLMDSPIDLTARADAEGCVATRKTGDGMAQLGPTAPQARASFVEVLRQRPFKLPSEIKDTADMPIPFSLTSGSDRTEFFVWFGGSACRSRCIDWYDSRTLKYRRSMRLTGNTGIGVLALAIRSGMLIVLGTRNDVPVIAAFRIPAR